MSALRRMAVVVFVARLVVAATDCKPQGPPCYKSEWILNSASSQPALASYTFATLYGENLSYDTGGAATSAELPKKLANVGVMVNGQQAIMLYVSPNQVNFILPLGLAPGPVRVQLTREAQAGPEVTVTLLPSAPALFQLDSETPVAVRHADWSSITRQSPARAGDIVHLYAAGLGDVFPPLAYWEPPQTAAWISGRSEFRLLLNDTAVDAAQILYVGVAPKFAGLYQIDLRLPAQVEKNPAIRIELSGQSSPRGLRLPVE